MISFREVVTEQSSELWPDYKNVPFFVCIVCPDLPPVISPPLLPEDLAVTRLLNCT